MNDSLATKLLAILTTGTIGTWADIPADIQALAYLMLIDTATGVASAFKGHSASSNTLGKGLRKKLGVAAIILVCYIGRAAGLPSIVLDVAVLGFIAQEVLSIIENVGALGVVLPTGLAKRLAQLQPAETTTTTTATATTSSASVTTETTTPSTKITDHAPEAPV